jgi:hypothetical protein
MSLKKKIEFLSKNPLFPLRLFNLVRRLKKIKKNGRQVWILQCDFKGHFPYLKPYWEYARKRNDVEIFFSFGISDQEKPTQFLIENRIPADRILDPIDLVAQSSWDVYVSPTEWGNVFPKNSDCIRTQIFHTLADKGLEYSDELLKFNTIFANGPIHHEFLEKYIFSKYPGSKEKSKVFNIGYAKIDELFDDSVSDRELKKSFNINDNENRKVILYAPNWEAGSALRTYGEDVFKELSKMDDFIILIKLHYMSLLNPSWIYATGGTDWKSILDIYRKYQHIRIMENTNINACLRISDIMLTDYGGASLEFITMDKPVVYLDCPGFFDERGHDVFEKNARETGHLINEVSQIPLTIRNAIKDNDPECRSKRRILCQKLLYNPGKAAAAGYTTLLECARKPKVE